MGRAAKTITRSLIWLGLIVSIIIPAVVWYQSWGSLLFLTSSGVPIAQKLGILFPLVGLYAYTLVFIQLLLGALMPLWNLLFDSSKLLRFHITEGTAALFFIVLHPTLLYLQKGLEQQAWPNFFRYDYVAPGLAAWVIFGQIALVLLLVGIGAALLRASLRRWRILHYLNYAAFYLIFFHSWKLGTHVQGTALKYVWVFYFITGLVATVLGIHLRHQIKKRSARLISQELRASPQ